MSPAQICVDHLRPAAWCDRPSDADQCQLTALSLLWARCSGLALQRARPTTGSLQRPSFGHPGIGCSESKSRLADLGGLARGMARCDVARRGVAWRGVGWGCAPAIADEDAWVQQSPRRRLHRANHPASKAAAAASGTPPPPRQAGKAPPARPNKLRLLWTGTPKALNGRARDGAGRASGGSCAPNPRPRCALARLTQMDASLLGRGA